MEQGTYDERRVYKLDLFEREPSEAAAKLTQYLSLSNIKSGQALDSAREEYRNRNRAAQARAAIPAAWQELVGKGDELLVELLASAVESKAGIKPEEDDVLAFLTSLGKPFVLETAIKTAGRQQGPVDASSRSGTLVIRGKAYRYGNAKDAMVTVLTELAQTDPSFLQRCAQHPDAQGRKRQYIARTPEELYPDRPDLREYREQLPGGWFVATNLNNVLKKSIIRLSAEVAGLTFGKDVIVEF
jgi:hypothetical protein